MIEHATQIPDDLPACQEMLRGLMEQIGELDACSCCKDGVTSVPAVANPIAEGLAGPGLLAYVMVNKYSEHLPLYRQQDVLARHGIVLSRRTLCGWMAQCAELLRPLYELMRKRILEADVINADETPVQVLDKTLDATRTGYFWAYISTGEHGYTDRAED
jgi:transposase